MNIYEIPNEFYQASKETPTFRLSMEKDMKNRKCTMKCIAEKYVDGWLFQITNNKNNCTLTHSPTSDFNSDKELIDYIQNGFQSYQYDFETIIK